MPVFVNYFADDTRSSPLNLTIARVVFAGYLIWKTVWYDWGLFAAVPYIGVDNYSFLVPSNPTVLVVEKWLLIGLLVAVMLGYRLGVTTFLSAVLVAHLGAVRYTLVTSGGTTSLFFSAYFLIMLGLYREQDVLTLDAVRRSPQALRDGGTETSETTLGGAPSLIADLRTRVESPSRRSYRMTALKWNLVIIALVYFGSGFDKLVSGGLAWAAVDNLSRILLVWNTLYAHPIPIGGAMLEYPLLISAAAVGTLVLEVGLLVAVLARAPITLFIVGILSMQIVIALAVGPFFFDVFAFFAMFVAWDTIYERVDIWRGS